MREILNTTLMNGIIVSVTFTGKQYILETKYNGLTQKLITTKAFEVFNQINEIQHLQLDHLSLKEELSKWN